MVIWLTGELQLIVIAVVVLVYQLFDLLWVRGMLRLCNQLMHEEPSHSRETTKRRVHRVVDEFLHKHREHLHELNSDNAYSETKYITGSNTC